MIETIRIWVSDKQQKYLPHGSLRARFLLGSFWSLLGAGFARGLNFIAFVLCARILGNEGFGELGMVQSTVGMFAIFAGFGLGATGTKYIAEYREKNAAKAGRILGLTVTIALISGVFLALLLFLFATQLAEKTIAAPHLVLTLRIAGGIVLFDTLNGVFSGALVGFESFRVVAQVNFKAGLLSFPVIIIGAYFGAVEGAVSGLVFSVATGTLLNFLALRKETRRFGVPFLLRDCWREKPVLWRFSLPGLIAGAMVGPVIWAANALLANRSGGYAELGLLNAANQIRLLALFVPAMAFRSMLPILSSELNKERHSGVSLKLHALNSYSTWYFATVATVFLLFLVKPILMIYGDDFLSGRLAMILILSSIPVMTYKSGIARLIQAKTLLWYGVFSNMLWGALLLGMAVLLSKYGAAGIAGAVLGAYFINTIIMTPIYFRKLDMTRFITLDLRLGVALTLAVVSCICLSLCTLSIWLSAFLTFSSLSALALSGLFIYSLLYGHPLRSPIQRRPEQNSAVR